VKIRSVVANRRKRSFEICIRGRSLSFPFAKCDPRPSASDTLARVFVDAELGAEAFTFVLASGREGSVHLDQVLDYNKDPAYLRDMLLYQLTLEAQRRVAHSSLSRREIIRRLRTSAAQFYRLLDQTNRSKSIDEVLRLLSVLDCDVEFRVHAKSA
jgi:hypothetical protein